MRNPLRSISRRDFLRASAIAGGTAGLHLVGLAQPAHGPRSDSGAEFINADTQAAIDRGLAALAQEQQRDGSFSNHMMGSAAGITGLAGLALLSSGNQPGRGKYSKNVTAAVNYLLKNAQNTHQKGFLGGSGVVGGQPSGMYSHGFASLFLAEVCGMLPDPARQKLVRATLEQATEFSVNAQNDDGGWRYVPRAPYADVSVTVAIMMALRAARNAGVLVNIEVARKGSKYIRECQLNDGGFSYFRGTGQGGSAFARSAAAIVGIYSANNEKDEAPNAKAIDRGLRYLQQFTPSRQFNNREIPSQHYYYGQYYAALGMWTAGGEFWRTWFPAIRDELLSRARANNGLWSDQFHGIPYATAIALIILQLPNNYLPILQK